MRGLVCVNIPPLPRESLPPLTVTKQRFGEGFYQNYFQEPGVAEASLEKDVAATLRLTYSGIRSPEPSDGFLGLFAEPETLPAWLTEEDLATFVDQFTASGFAGGLNWYRNLDPNWELTAAWQDAPITAPSLYISGENDAMRTVYPMDDAGRAVVPKLRGVIDVPGCGHWTQGTSGRRDRGTAGVPAWSLTAHLNGRGRSWEGGRRREPGRGRPL